MRVESSLRGRRDGFSFVEILLVSTLSLLVLALLWQAWETAARQASRLEQRLAGLSGAQLVMDRLRQDVACALYAPGDAVPVVDDARGGKANRLNLLIWSGYRLFARPAALYDPAENDPSWIEADRVRYEFDPSSGYIYRVSPAGDERLAFARFTKVAFVYQPGGPAGPETVRIELTLAGATDAIVLELPMPYRAEYRATGLWPDAYFHTQPKVRERS